MQGYNQANVYVIQRTHHVAIQESDKSSRLTGRTLCVSTKLLYTICDVGHPHEMVFVEPSHIFFDLMVGNQDDSLAFELRSLPGVSKIAIGVGTLLSLAGEVCAKLFGHILWEDICWVDGRVTEVQHTQILSLWQQCQPLLHDGATFASDGQKDFPHLYWVLWDRACLRYTVWA
jgi:hypothetical protein